MNRRGFLRFLGLGAVAAPFAPGLVSEALAGVPEAEPWSFAIYDGKTFAYNSEKLLWSEGLSPSAVNASARRLQAEMNRWRSAATKAIASNT